MTGVPKEYDYIIAGAGCAGLSLALRLAESNVLTGKRLLIVDKSIRPAEKDVKTWCFWEKEPGYFQQLVSRQWKGALVFAGDFQRRLNLAPYTYKMIRSPDFFHYAFKRLEENPNVTIRQGTIKAEGTGGTEAWISLDGEVIRASYVFSSLTPGRPSDGRGIHLLQHFLGWEVETDSPVFDPEAAILMDFNVPQAGATAFMYLLPFSEKEALVEYTVFSDALLEKKAYVQPLKTYLSQRLHAKDYRILREEQGVIPMSSFNYPERKGRIIYTGTAGGLTKPSTGYTFTSIQRYSDLLCRTLETHGHPYAKGKTGSRRFKWYDHTLLDILSKPEPPGKAIFRRLFESNPPSRILAFLDEQTSPAEDLLLTSRLQKRFFIPAALRQIRSLLVP